MLDLATIAAHPEAYHYALKKEETSQTFILRPLKVADEQRLAELLEKLTPETKKFYSQTLPGKETAREHVEAIGKYDKLRFVLENPEKELIGLFEFSFGLPEGDRQRFAGYGIKLSEITDCRIGPILRDDYQSHGLGSLVLPHLLNLAREFGKTRIILWGGVMQHNSRAIRFYEKNDFTNVGSFTNSDGATCFDMILELWG